MSVKIPHKLNLMRVDLLESEQIDRTLLGIETDRNSLDDADVVNCTLLVKIC